MIAGTIILEDTTINFTHHDFNKVTYTVSNNLTGTFETITCDGLHFSKPFPSQYTVTVCQTINLIIPVQKASNLKTLNYAGYHKTLNP